MSIKPCSPACARNQAYILAELKQLLPTHAHVLEIGSGTGEHAIHFAKALPHIHWQTSDLENNHPGIQSWLEDAELKNVLFPLSLDIDQDTIPNNRYDVVFTANTFHIMSWDTVKNCIQKVGEALEPGGMFIIYGPFNREGQYTSDSNAQFDAFLKSVDPKQGIRDFDDVDKAMKAARLKKFKQIAMPANNFMLVYQKVR